MCANVSQDTSATADLAQWKTFKIQGKFLFAVLNGLSYKPEVIWLTE